ncbi:hypothetical protein BVG16_05260 [Paenibacillus selenitireducens]|uniref:Glycosyl transferase family 1 n=1 Tax=Paenibacillus selenitireducens TaxID=1324314 RepID=A0A1T2XKB0_9BACL|nr:glycosyltransferase family 4 protein [Paenibacillus selenitireducens]OPA80156.1 hypothetical protein BVG16_05260 [Paenibacillus selenitireducens]
MLRIAVVTPGSFPIPSVRSSSVERVVEHVVPLVSDRLSCVIFGRASKRVSHTGDVHGVPCYRVPYKNGRQYIEQVGKQLLRLKPDLIQVENRPRYVLALKKRMPKTPVWLYLHSVSFITKPSISPRKLLQCCHQADRIIVNSHFLKEYLVQRYAELEKKIYVNHLGVDLSQFASRWEAEELYLREKWLKQHGLTGRKVMMFVGRLKEQKGVHHLLRAMRSILAKEPSAMLVIVGGAYYGSHRKTTYVRQLERLAKRFAQHVRFVPYIPYHEIASWYRIADVIVVPSVRNEAFGLVNVEAMAAGIPVVATRSGGMREIVEHGVTGFLVDPRHLAKELERYITVLLGNPLLQEQMGRLGRQRVLEHFTWQHMADRWVDMIRFGMEPHRY